MGAQSSMTATTGDSGLRCLVLLLHFHGVAADGGQIGHRFGGVPIGVTEMLRCAKEFKLRARAVKAKWKQLKKMPLPAIAQRSDGTFLILAKVTQDRALVQGASAEAPELVSREDFEAVWCGRLLLMARRASLGELARRFDFTWFVQAMGKYR